MLYTLFCVHGLLRKKKWVISEIRLDIIFKIWPWKSKVKVMCKVIEVRGLIVGPTYRRTSLMFHVNQPSVEVQGHSVFHSKSISIWFLSYGYSKIWPWKSKVNIIDQGHIVGPISYRLISLLFHANCIPIHVIWLHVVFDLQNPRSKS